MRVLLASGLLVGAYAVGLHTWIAAQLLSSYTGGMTFELVEGLSPNPALSAAGPYDERLGYRQLPETIERLEAHGFRVAKQANVSARFERVRRLGLFPLYTEKTQAGLRIVGHDGRVISPSLFPERVYPSFEMIPPLIVSSLLFLENRELLDDRDPHSNPAVEWDRLAAAVIHHAGGRFLGGDGRFGASTLATQLEKVRHSPDGVTGSASEKVRQMGTATLRSYLQGPRTDLVRRQILTDYLNSLPVGAVPGYGEIIGVRDGMRAWFGLDPDSADIALRRISPERVTDEAARAYRAALALLLAQRRPTHYLLSQAGRESLNRLTDAHLRILAADSVIPDQLAAAALKVDLASRPHAPPGLPISFVERKAINSVRSHLLDLIGVSNLYQLDRFDLTVQASVDGGAQKAVTERIRDLGRREFVRSAGLTGERLLGEG
ncbi:MAG TPA: transglycosylase domain-containing protein, partial [Gemmatimonadales bacterium]